jgi:uncharacterized DUF497 family protein
MNPETVYDFEWDATKARSNERKHDVRFEEAASVFLDPLALTVYDKSSSLDEERWFILGFDARGRLLAVAHTYQISGIGSVRIRIVSGAKGHKTRAQLLRGSIGSDEAMNATPTKPSHDEDMPAEIDFSDGTRGKFYRPNSKLNMPVYLEVEVQAYLGQIAARKGVSLSDVANDLLKKEIAIIESAK